MTAKKDSMDIAAIKRKLDCAYEEGNTDEANYWYSRLIEIQNKDFDDMCNEIQDEFGMDLKQIFLNMME